MPPTFNPQPSIDKWGWHLTIWPPGWSIIMFTFHVNHTANSITITLQCNSNTKWNIDTFIRAYNYTFIIIFIYFNNQDKVFPCQACFTCNCVPIRGKLIHYMSTLVFNLRPRSIVNGQEHRENPLPESLDLRKKRL